MAQTLLESSAVSAFCGSVATMLSAGIQTDEAVVMLADNREASRFQEVCDEMYRRIVSGTSFAQAAEESGGFPRHALDMFDIGERSGHLEQVLRNLEMYYDEEDRMFAKLRAALGYPVALLAIMSSILLFASLVILPAFNDVYEGVAGTLTTESLVSIALSRSIGWVALCLTGFCLLGGMFLLVASRSERGRERVVRRLEKAPLVSRPLYQLALSRFTASLATYVSTGMTSEEAMRKAMATVQHARLRASLEGAYAAMVDISQPLSLVQALGEHEVLEPLYVRMATVGVRSGTFEETLAQLSQTFFDDAILHIDHALDHVEPLLAAFLTLSVGTTLVAVMLPLVGIMGSIG